MSSSPQSKPASTDHSSESLKILQEAAAYGRYLYEQENQRIAGLNSKGQNYLLSQAVTLGAGLGLLKWLYPSPDDLSGGDAPLLKLIALGIAGIGLLLIMSSFIVTVYSLRVRKMELLTAPNRFLDRTIAAESQSEAIAATVTDFVVAIQRNYARTERRGRILWCVTLLYITGTLILLVGGTMLLATSVILGEG